MARLEERVRGAPIRLAELAGAATSPVARAELLRGHRYDAIGRESPAVAVQSGDLWYFVPTNDRIGRHAFLTGGFEQEVMEAALDLLGVRLGHPLLPGRTFVDVGANIGTSTIPAVKIFGARHALAIEPAQANLRLLRANVVANELDGRVTIVEAALSNQEGALDLERGPGNSGDCRIRVTDEPGALDETSWATETVVATTFDQVLAEHRIPPAEIGLVWIDAQGHEAHILEGASSLVESDVPVVAEYWPYGLRRAGGLERFHTLVATRYRTVIDVRASIRTGHVDEIAAGDIARLAERYRGDHDREYTDIALLK